MNLDLVKKIGQVGMKKVMGEAGGEWLSIQCMEICADRFHSKPEVTRCVIPLLF